jgi:hypothetical protein
MSLLRLLLLLAGLSPFLTARAADPVFHFETGPPAWRGERIALPPGFAPDLGWTGVEEIRFAPGMFEAEAPDFFSYILVFHLAPDSDVSEAGLKRELLVYYRGLAKAVMASKQKIVDPAGFAITLNKAEGSALAAPEAAPKAEGWTGTLDWIEPFATEKPQKLHLEVHVWKEGDHPVVLSCVSPVDPGGEIAWPALRAIRKSFRFAP